MLGEEVAQIVPKSVIADGVPCTSLHQPSPTRHTELRVERVAQRDQLAHARGGDLVLVEPQEPDVRRAVPHHLLHQLANRRQLGVPQFAVYVSGDEGGRTDEGDGGDALAAVVEHVAVQDREDDGERLVGDQHVLEGEALHAVDQCGADGEQVQLHEEQRRRVWSERKRLRLRSRSTNTAEFLSMR